MAKKKIAVRMDEDLLDILGKIAAGSGRNESEVIREALGQYVETHKPPESCYDLARRIGVIKIYRGLPSNLSTNKRYFRGFAE